MSMASSPCITRVRTRDLSIKLGEGEGTDAVHTSSQYGYAVCVLETGEAEGAAAGGEGAAASPLFGSGLAFTLGAGGGLVCDAIEALARPVLVGRDIEGVMAEGGKVFKALADETQWRWLGPHKGVVQLALAAIVNAAWDLWAKSRGVPLWRLLLDLSPAELVATLDLSYVDDVVSAEAAVAMLEREAATRGDRTHVVEEGYPGYDTSFGWMGFDDDTIVRQAVEAVRDRGFSALKLKVGSPDPERDVRRAKLVRDAVGPDVRLMLDCNQQWTLKQSVEMCTRLAADVKPFWIEEPTHPDDVMAHAELSKVCEPLGLHVAAGEAMPNRVVFKNFMQAKAISIVQNDPTRQGGVSECIVIAMMARVFGLRVLPHVGCMGQISQHLVLFNHVALGHEAVFLEHIPHLRPYFVAPATCEGGRYVTPREAGASSDLWEGEALRALPGATEAPRSRPSLEAAAAEAAAAAAAKAS